MDMGRVWLTAETRQRISTLATFVAAFSGDEERRREAERLTERAFATDLADLEEIQEIVWTLTIWAEDLAGHPHYPTDPRIDEADRRIRDHVKDILRDRVPHETLRWMLHTQFSLDVTFLSLRRAPTLDPRTREDAFYIYGRATVSLDLGHREAAERGLELLQELREKHAPRKPLVE